MSYKETSTSGPSRSDIVLGNKYRGYVLLDKEATFNICSLESTNLALV